MGASTSAALNAEDLEELRQGEICGFSSRELHKLYRRFQELDRKQRGVLSTAELKLIPELAMSPLCHRIIALFDKEGTDEINFKHFVKTLWVFSSKSGIEKKMKAAFDVYDVNGDGKISDVDLFSVLKLMAGTNLSDDVLRDIAKETIRNATNGKKEFLEISDFANNVGEEFVSKTMTIAFQIFKL
jgi:serine/threonine-protein phosphatase 2B regulatory subunit